MRTSIAGRLDRYLLIVVIVHLGVTFVHAAAHAALQILPTGFDFAFILVVIILGPPAALVTVRFRRPIGLGLLALLMDASFVYGFYNHFVVTGRDNVAYVASEPWTAAFILTGASLGVLEVLAAGLALVALRFELRIPSGPAEPLA